MARDALQEAKEYFSDAKDAMSETHARFRDDLKFSNPACPEQWDSEAVAARKGRVTLTLDRTNQFIAQIVNDARQNKPSIQVLPADSNADVEVAKRLNGIIRHIEYTSRAGIAYDTAIELSARVGLGWLRIIPRVTRQETNEQEILIQREHDPCAILLGAESIEPDGSDAMCGFAETTVTVRAFERMYPKSKRSSWDSEGWFGEDSVRICEYFKIVEKSSNRIAAQGPDGSAIYLTEDQYWDVAKQTGVKLPVLSTFQAIERKVKWCKLSGLEILEETEFPSRWIPLIPVLGYELWVDGKRYLCGMVRRMMDSQKLHNFEMSALAETMRSQPKAPFLLPARAIEGYENDWAKLNTGNPAYLPYNDLPNDPGETPINPPIRLAPPAFPTAYANGATLAVNEMEASVGMYKSNLGQQSNAVSGRAKLADQREGDTANFHYIDNLRRSMEHMGRIIVDMIPRVYDTRRQAKIMGEDGEQSAVEIDPQGPALQRQGSKIVAINPGVGAYDVRVKIGPSFTSLREQTAQRLVELGQGNPPLAAALAPLLVKMGDLPEADKISKVAIALLPPPVQQAYTEDENTDIPPAIQAQLQAKDQQMQAMNQAMTQAASVIQDLQDQLNQKNTEVQAKAQVEQAKLQTTLQKIEAKEADINAAEQLLAKEVELVKARIELDRMKAVESVRAERETQSEAKETNDDLTALAEAIRQGQETLAQAQAKMAEAIAQNTTVLAQTQSLTMEALEDVAESMSANRQITLKRTPDGMQATSVVVQ